MIIGLLEAETLPEKITHEFGSYGDMFKKLLSSFDDTLLYKHYFVEQENLPNDIHECDAYIITGSRHNAYDNDEWIKKLKEFIRQIHLTKKKCLGVCFGHQVIAEALGGKTEKSAKGWGIGVRQFQTKNKPEWFKSNPSSFSILVSHQDQVSQLPPTANLYATSHFCPNGSFYIGNHIFTLQGHPEFTTSYLKFLMTKREKLFGEELYRSALNTLSENEVTTGFDHWIYDFFSQNNHA